MNFIGTEEDPASRLELKYCERCGGLFLRRLADTRVHCALCVRHLAQFEAEEVRKASPERRTRGPRVPSGPKVKATHPTQTSNIKSLQGIAAAEVWA